LHNESLSDQLLDRAITREEFFALTAVAKGFSGSSTNKTFEDLSTVTPQYAKYIGEFINEGIIVGVIEKGKNYIKPKTEITRSEAAVILSKIFELTDEVQELNFKDYAEIGDWAIPYLAGVVSAKLINGYPDNTIRPANHITIAETIAILSNSHQNGYLTIGKSEIYAGNGESTLKDGENLSATFCLPTGLAARDGKIYVADRGNNAIRSIGEGIVSTVAGSDIGRNEYNEVIGSFRDGINALFDQPSYLATVKNGLLVTDTENHLIRFINQDGVVTTYAGNLESGLVGGTTAQAKFNKPTGIAVDSKGNVYVADTGNNVIRKIDENKNVTIFAGGNSKGGYKDGERTMAEFNAPMGLFIVNDVLYVADTGNQRIRMIKDNTVSTIAGSGNEKDDSGIEFIGDFTDGDRNIAQFNFPMNLTVDQKGNLYVADNGNGVIRRINSNGIVTTLKIEELKRPTGLVVKDNYLYVSDTLLNKIFRVQI